MAASDVAITLGAILLWEAPGGDVRLADGGVITFDPGSGSLTFESEDADYGTVVDFDTVETGLGDQVDGGTFVFAPPEGAPLSDWWRADLENTRLRVWIGEVNGAALEEEELLADWLIDTVSREQAEGQDLLSAECMTRQEKLFQTNQGNVCSDRFHDSIWSGERGFENCHDGPQYFAWGTQSPSGQGVSQGGASFGGGPSSPVPVLRMSA
jgi:hypothetical protein